MVPIIVIPIATSLDIDSIDDHPQNLGIHLIEDLFGSEEGFLRRLSTYHDKDNSIDRGRENDGVSKTENRRRIENKMVKPFFQGFQHILEEV
jgi:hypothetical protein